MSRRKRIADLLLAAHRTGNWDKPLGAYKQLVDIVRPAAGSTASATNAAPTDQLDRKRESAVHLPEDLADKFALAMSEIRQSYVGHEEECAQHAMAIFGNMDEKEWFDDALEGYNDVDFRRISNHAAWSSMGLWRPTPIETSVESLRRWRDLTGLRAMLAGSACSLVLGGSLSYGAFYNVHGNREGIPASDLDLVFIGDADEIALAAERFAGIAGPDPQSIGKLRQRIAKFLSDLDDDNTVLSHKLAMWTTERDPMLIGIPVESRYEMSVHFLTDAVLAHILVEPCSELTPNISGRMRTVRVFRDTDTDRKDHMRTFSGRNYFNSTPSRECTLGFMRTANVYFIDGDNHYCPGQIQSHLLTSRELVLDNRDVRLRFDRLRTMLWDRLDLERVKAPHEDLRMSLADVRRERFAPNVIRAIDEDPRRGRR